MKVLYDHQIFDLQKYGGISKYFSELIYASRDKYEYEISLKFSDNHHLRSRNLLACAPIPDYKKNFLTTQNFPGKGRILNWTKRLFPKNYPNPYEVNKRNSIDLLKKGDFDIFHPTYYDPYFLDYIGNKPFVVTIHDMTYELFPEFFPLEDQTFHHKKVVALAANSIIAVSENTKKDIIDIWGVESEKIDVVYHGVSNNNWPMESVLNLPDKYLLYVGARNGYKNFTFMIHAIADFLEEFDIQIICTGPVFSLSEVKLFENLNIIPKLVHIEANEQEMHILYKRALALVFPSLYEGFGMPILEAYSNDCPVVLSNTSCFPEIAKHYGIYFDPKSKQELIKSLTKVVEKRYITSAVIPGLDVLQKEFSWESAADQTNNVYTKIIYM
jgi:glycosyltransferase involved in cell wall biosynthesis